MKIAILGGGFTGLTASYYLSKKGNDVTLFERENVLGGLASGFKSNNWDWSLECAYHHLFHSDNDILDLANEIGFNDIFFQEPETSSLYEIINPTPPKLRGESNYRIIPVDTPQDFLRFPLLSFPEKIRSAMVLAFLKFSPHFSFYEKQIAQRFLQKTMGKNVWNILWQELFRKKFGKYAENVVASFIWARINKRTKKLGYVRGGFQNLINYLENTNSQLGVHINKECAVEVINRVGNRFVLTWRVRSYNTRKEVFDAIISTLPTPTLIKLGSALYPVYYLQQLQKLQYLHAVVLILETKEPILNKTYWLNVCTPKLPLMIIAQHTNFVDKQYYGHNHIAYVGWYVDAKSRLLTMNQKEIIEFVLPHLRILNSSFQILNSYLFRGPFAQPIFDKEFVKNKPDFETPIENFYVANLDMTYPYDRGTNYAVKLGKEAAKFIQ